MKCKQIRSLLIDNVGVQFIEPDKNGFDVTPSVDLPWRKSNPDNLEFKDTHQILLSPHLRTCKKCAQYYTELKEITELFTGLPVANVPQYVNDELYAKILNYGLRIAKPYLLYPRFVYGGLVTVTLIVLCYFFYNREQIVFYRNVPQHQPSYTQQDVNRITKKNNPDFKVPGKVLSDSLFAGHSERKRRITSDETLHPALGGIQSDPGVGVQSHTKQHTRVVPQPVTTVPESIRRADLNSTQSNVPELASTVEQIKRNLSTSQPVANSTDVAKTIESVYTMAERGIEVPEIRQVMDTVLKNRFTVEQITDLSYTLGNVNPVSPVRDKSTVPAVHPSPVGRGGVRSAPQISRAESQLPVEFKFKEVRPKLFTPNNDGVNDTVGFYFDNPTNKEIYIRIFDLSKTLIKEIEIIPGKVPGWDGTNADGQVVESGIYVYQIQVGKDVVRGTVVLAK